MSLHERDAFKALCEMKFSFFCRQYLKVVEPETEFIWGWYLEVLCKTCEDIYYGRLKNVDINIPPRMLKSLIFSVLFPAWIWTKDPSKKIIAASSAALLANGFNIKRRELIESPEYQLFWPIKMKSYSNKITHFENVHNGFMKSVSANGKVTGSGADYLITDDLIDVKDAFSRVKRLAIRLWYSSVFFGRAQNKKTVRRININQRSHDEDVSDELEKKHKFDRLVLQMIKTNRNKSTIYYKDPRAVGEYLMPERYGPNEEKEDRQSLGTYGFSSQMQQEPMAIEGGIVKSEWIRYYNKADIPYYDRMIITGDLNFQAGEQNDYACFQCWGKYQGNYYLIDIIRGQWSYKETKTRFKSFCDKHPNANEKFIENKANGPALISDMGLEIPGMIAWPDKESGLASADKVQRLHLVSPDWEDGKVYLPKDMEIVESFKLELLSFTDKGSTTGNDDMVDTHTTALIELRKSESFIG